MVNVIGAEARKNTLGEEFYVLILMGGLEMVKSKQTGKYYATARKASVTTTFDERTAKGFIGTKLNGCIERASCEPYDYKTEDGEIIELNFTYQYNPAPNTTEEVVLGKHALVDF